MDCSSTVIFFSASVQSLGGAFDSTRFCHILFLLKHLALVPENIRDRLPTLFSACVKREFISGGVTFIELGNV